MTADLCDWCTDEGLVVHTFAGTNLCWHHQLDAHDLIGDDE